MARKRKKARGKGHSKKGSALSNYGKVIRGKPRQFAKLSFDSAQTNLHNYRHWQAADYLSANAAANPEVRRTLRTRSRYEAENNCYAKGVLLTLAYDAVGTGPRLQMLTDNASDNRKIEKDFASWAKEIKLAQKLRTMRVARATDGEVFAQIAPNPGMKHNVQLGFSTIEADRVASASSFFQEDLEVDGIRFDEYGNRVSYRVLENHPGDLNTNDAARIIPERLMIHAFRVDRPGQERGVPEIGPALPLFAQLRRYTLAVLSAAEAAADFAGILYTDAPPDGEAEETEPFDPVKLDRNTLMTMPAGWRLEQVNAQQPSTSYTEFKHELLNEIVRCVCMPFNIGAANSSGYNYASGRLDHQAYYKSIKVEQSYVADTVLDRIFEHWYEQYLYSIDKAFEISRVDGSVAIPQHTWFWDGMEHVDPVKEAQSQKIKLENNLTTLAIEHAKQGHDYEEALRQRKKEIEMELELVQEKK